MVLKGDTRSLDYGSNSSFHFGFHYPSITPRYSPESLNSPYSFHSIFHYPNIAPIYSLIINPRRGPMTRVPFEGPLGSSLGLRVA